jgi:chromosomal replication initiator protein
VVITISTIQARVASHFGFTMAELRGRRRYQRVSRARAIALYLARELTGASYPEIGQRFGGLDHTSVIYAHRRVAGSLLLLAEAQALASVLNASPAGPVST